MAMPLSAAKVSYKEIHENTTELESQTPHPEESNYYSTPIWDMGLSTEFDPLYLTLPSDKDIMEEMNLMEKPWGTNYQRSYFLPIENSLGTIGMDIYTDRNF